MSPATYRYSDDAPTWSNSYLWPPLLRLLERYTEPGARIFELGCGNGATARMLVEHGYEVTGVDPSESGIAIARQFEGARLRFDVGSTTDDLVSRFSTFPVVVSMEVIEHCPSSREFITAFRALMDTGGVGIISTPYHAWLKTMAVVVTGNFDKHFDPLWEGGHLKFFSIRKLRQLFAEAGLASVQFVRVGRVPFLAKSVVAVVSR